MQNRPAKPEKVAKFESRMSNCLDIIENVWLKDTQFLIGNSISVADIFCICELEQPRKLYKFFASPSSRHYEPLYLISNFRYGWLRSEKRETTSVCLDG